MANSKAQRAAALLLAALTLVPGLGLAQLHGLLQPPALPAPALDLADKAFVGSFDQLDALEGAPELAALQPNLEAVLRWYAQERGFVLTPPRTPEVGSLAPLAPALQALSAATGKPLPPDQLEAAAELASDLQQALARIVLAYVQAARAYTEALAGVSRADLAAVARGEPPSTQPDGGKMASAALLLDRAVRESAPVLRKWALLLAVEERARGPSLKGFTPDALLRAGAMTDSLRDAVHFASVTQGWQPVQARFQPMSASPSEALARLYTGLGIPLLPLDLLSFSLLDTQPAPMQQLVSTLADGVLQGAAYTAAAEQVVSEAEIEAAYAKLATLDLEQLKAAEPSSVPVRDLQAILETLERADQALMLRLQGAAVLADALTMVRDLAPEAAASVAGFGETQTDSHSPMPGVTLPPVPTIETPDLPNVGKCTLGEDPGGSVYLNCGGSNNTLSQHKALFDNSTLSLVVFNDEDGDGSPSENELMLRTPSFRDPANDIAFKDPYGFLLVGGDGRSVYDQRYGFVNVSLRVENGTVRQERRLLFTGAQAPVVSSVISEDLNFTLFEPQDNGVFNITFNPLNHTLAIVDLGGDDLYTHRPGGAQDPLLVYNSSANQRINRHVGSGLSQAHCFGTVSLLLGRGSPCTSGAGESENQIILNGLNLNEPENPGKTYLNFSNLSLPVRLGVVLDTSGSDEYNSPFNYTMGAARYGVGLLWDAELCGPEEPRRPGCTRTSPGHDAYLGTYNTTGAASHRGLGILLDERGDDVHSALNWSQGVGTDRGIGLAIDLQGSDRWFGGNYSMGVGGRERLEQCRPDGSCPNQGNALYGQQNSTLTRVGLGVLLDRRGDDSYDQVNASSNQGKGFQALGLLLDLGGSDRGLQTNLTARGEFGTLAVGMQETTLTDIGQGDFFVPLLSKAFFDGKGGGLILDAEMPDTAALQGRVSNAPARGFGIGATELEGDTNFVECPKYAAATQLVGDPTGGSDRRCVPLENQVEWKTLSRQHFLLRIPGLLGFGGYLSNDGTEAGAPVSDEEHLIHIDLAGNDVYRGPFGGASVPNMSRLDTEGDVGNPDPTNPRPREEQDMSPVFQGGLVAPVSLTVDVHGSDVYDGRTGMLGGERRNLTTPSLGGAWMGLGLLLDLGLKPVSGNLPPGRDVPPECGTGDLNDVYVGYNRSMGYGALYGVGALVDAEGDDCYVALGGDTGALDPDALSLGAARYGGLGLLLDHRGNDTYYSGNLSQGVAFLEPAHDQLPRRVGLTFEDATCHGPNSDQDLCSKATSSPQTTLGALVDGRGHDKYRFGNRSQGYGELRTNSSTSPPIQARRNLAGLFVDDGFEADNYTALGWSPQPAHRDNAFWCSPRETHTSPLNKDLARTLAALPRLETEYHRILGDLLARQGNASASAAPVRAAVATARGLLSGQLNTTIAAVPLDDQTRTFLAQLREAAEAALDQALASQVEAPTEHLATVNATVARVQRELDLFTGLGREGPNQQATCLRIEAAVTPTGSVQLVDLGAMGRGFDNLDFFANFLLAAGRFGQEFVRARSVLSAPAVVDVACARLTDSAAFANCTSLEGLVNVTAVVLWGPASFAYNANQLLRHVCARVTGLPAACDPLFEDDATLRSTCLGGGLPAGGSGDLSVGTPIGPVTATGVPSPGCATLPNAPVSLNVTGRALRLAGSTSAGDTTLFGNALRRVEFLARADGTDDDLLLGVMDRRTGLVCGPDFDDCPPESPKGNVSMGVPGDPTLIRLRWDTTSLTPAPDGLPELRTPDGAYFLLVRAYFQPDKVGGVDVLAEDQRYVLNHLGDEYGFYPGMHFQPATLDNAPAVYQLDYKDVSLAPDPPCKALEGEEVVEDGERVCRDPLTGQRLGPHHELRLDLTVSPRRDAQDSTFGKPYRVVAELKPLDVEARTLRLDVLCPATEPPEFDEQARLAGAHCKHEPATQGAGARQRIVAGWDKTEVASALVNGTYRLRVDVREAPEQGGAERSTLRCFARHGGPLEEFVELRGNVTGAQDRTLQDATQAWLDDQWKGFRVRIVAGKGLGQARGVVGNDLQNLTLDIPWGDLPDLTSRYELASPVCQGELAVDSITPETVAHLDPSRLGADQTRYVNKTVAYPEGRSISAADNATVPLRFETLNAGEKRSPVVRYDVRAVVRELPSEDLKDDALNVSAPPPFLADRGNVSIRVCPTGALDERPCIRRKAPEPLDDAATLEAKRNSSETLFQVMVQVSARDLAGNVDPLRLEHGVPVAEDEGIVDLDAPEAALCLPVSTFNADAHPDVARGRTKERVVPMAWASRLEGCIGAVEPRDNRGVEAVLIAYNVSAPDAALEPAQLERLWEPPPEQQEGRVARFDADQRGLQGELTNNRTLSFMARALDFAGNLQATLLQVGKTTYDIRPPFVEVLNLTASHDSITYRWVAQDREATPARVAQSFVEWGTLNASTGEPDLVNVAQAIQGGNQARAQLQGLLQNTDHYLRAVSLDDVGNKATLPVMRVRTEPVVNASIASPQPGDILTGLVELRLNVSDVRVDPVVLYNVSLVLVTPNGSMALDVENFTRRECVPPEPDCPSPLNVTQVVRGFQSARFPDSTEAFLRVALNNSLNAGHPVVVSAGPLKIDNSPPVTDLTIVAQGGPVWWRSSALLVLEPRDNITDVVHTEWSLDNITYHAYNASAPPIQDREGSLPFYFRSVDRAGNVEGLRIVSVNIDKQRPLGNLTIDQGARATNDPNVTVFLEAKDSLSGVANITLDAGDAPQELDRPERFARGRNVSVVLPAGEGERRVRVRVADLAGNVQELKASITVDTSPPEISQLRVERVGHTTATLSWRTSESSVTRVEYGPSGAQVLANRFQGNETARSHVVALQGLRPSLGYQFRVVAEDELGNKATTRGTFQTLPDVTPPGAARSLVAQDLGNGAVKLAWEPAFDDVGVDHYIVYRGVAGQLDELARAGETLYIDDRGIPGVVYDYAVQAVDLAGQSGPLSALASARATTRPLLLEPRVTPDRGMATTVFTYSVVLRDPDGDAPLAVRVRISGQAFEMRPQFEGTADFARGVLFALATRLPGTTLSGGFPTYQFEASDGESLVVAPDVPAAGPAVLGQGAILPGLSAARGIFGLPGFELALAVAALSIALLLLRHVNLQGRWRR